MANLTPTDKKSIIENHGKISKDEKVITFEKKKKLKPSGECKRLLVKLGYEVSNKSGAPYYPWIRYVLKK